ncbi:thiolase family protein [Variovorax sp. PBL-E5]|uniref:thiolase family protein n=1 Tax=Variovorax sp. PBL-E5 TaxID=434014 RepID=UPI001316A798|nr:thiolase family protein [Variovorax sp. PBL-E5]VTU39243.1 acetyl-CoA acetyltransferase [Variovorax sp. PBL-E5]
MTKSTVAVLGTFQTEFRKQHLAHTFVEQTQLAAVGALADAGMTPDDIDAVVFALAPTFFMGVADANKWAVDSIFAQGKPGFRVHTGGATGGSAIQAAYNLVRAGLFRSVLIVGAERIAETPDAQKVLNLIFDVFYERDIPLSTNTSAALWAQRYLHRYGHTQEDLARVVVRARRNASRNPFAHLKTQVTVEEVMASPMISYPLKLYEVCPRSSGSAAMVVGNLDMARRFQSRPAFINGVASRTTTHWFGDRMTPTADSDFFDFDVVATASRNCYAQAGIRSPIDEIQAVELYDPYSITAAVQLERLGFCSPGTALKLEREGHWDVEGGELPVNPSGGTLCTNPIAIAGLVRGIDAANQIMNKAGEMQVRNVKNTLSSSVGGIGQFYNCTIFGNEPFDHGGHKP